MPKFLYGNYQPQSKWPLRTHRTETKEKRVCANDIAASPQKNTTKHTRHMDGDYNNSVWRINGLALVKSY
jgi:hypothetical protein